MNNNVVSGNGSLDNNGGIVGIGNSTVNIQDNTITGNGSGVSNGAVLAAGNSNVTMTGNHVDGNNSLVSNGASGLGNTNATYPKQLCCRKRDRKRQRPHCDG